MSTTRLFLSFLLVVGLTLPCAAVEPTMVNLVMPDAKVVAGVDFDRAKNSPFGQYLVDRSRTEEAGFQRLADLTGFDPRRDLREALVASAESGMRGQSSLAIARGVFDHGKLIAAASVHGGTVNLYQGVVILAGRSDGSGKKEDGSIGLLHGALVVAGPASEVKAAIDRYRSGAKLDPGLAARIQAAGGSYDAWVLTTTSPVALAQGSHPNLRGELIQSIESVSGGVRLGVNVEVSAEAVTRSEKDAAALVDVFKFLLSMAASNQDPKSPMGQALDSLQTTVDGRTARFTFAVPEQELERLFQSPRRPARGGARVRPVSRNSTR